VNRSGRIAVERAMRRLASGLAAVLLVGQIAVVTHELRVVHVTCEHGQIVHAAVGRAPISNRSALVSGAGTTGAHEHGCAILFHSRSQARPADRPAPAQVTPPETPRLAPLVALRAPRTAPFRIAPARSPPA
jgi:hypothetical protein